MSAKRLLVVLLFLAAVAAALFFVLSGEGDDGGGGSASPGDTSAEADPGDDEPDAERRRRRDDTPSRRWRPEGPGTVVGVVREYGSDTPLAGVRVTLEAGLPGPDTVLEAKTLSDGTFTFDEAINFDGWLLRVVPPEPLDERVLNGVEVVTGKSTNVGAVYVTPNYSVPGEVVDEQGAPIPGAEVRVLREAPSGNRMDFLRLIRELPVPTPSAEATVTDENGKFALTQVPPGTYDIEIGAEGYSRRVERRIPLSPALVDRPLRFVLTAGFEVRGRVVRPGGGDVSGITIAAFHEPRGEADLFTMQRHHTVTDENGEFEVSGLSSGEYLVAATPEGYPYVLRDDVRVPGTDFVEIVLKGDCSLFGKVSDEAGAGIAEAQVILITDGGSTPVVGATLTEGDGSYRIDGLKAGRVQVFLVRAEGYGSYPDDLSQVFRGRGAMQLVPGENEKDVTLAGGATVKGKVIDQSSDEPIEGVLVRLVSPMSLFGGERQAVTGADGTFEIVSVPQGPALLKASKDGWFQPGVNMMSVGMLMQGVQRGGEPQADKGRGATISITESGQVVERELKLAQGSTVNGVVLSPDGEPVAGASVSLRRESQGGRMGMLMALMGGFETRLSQDGGRFSLPGPAPGEQVRVEASAQGWLSATSEPFTVAPGKSFDDVEVRLRRGATLEGVVRGDDGQPVEGALVRAVPAGEGSNSWQVRRALSGADPSVTSSEGRFVLPRLEPGKLVVQVDHEDFLQSRLDDVEVEDGKTVTRDFALVRGLEIHGTIVGPGGEPVMGAEISARLAKGEGSSAPRPGGLTGSRSESATSAADGTFAVKRLTAGEWNLHAEADGFADADVVSSRAGARGVTLRLERAFTISGTVRAEDGEALGAVQMQLVKQVEKGEEQAGWTRSGADGSFVFEDVRAGDYVLRTSQGWGAGAVNVPDTEIPVSAGQTGVELIVKRGLEISGSVFDDEGNPIAQGWVNASLLVSEDGTTTGRNRGGQIQQGSFNVSGLGAGRYRLQLSAAARSTTVEVDAGTTDLEVRFPAGGTVSGAVRHADGTPAKGVSVWAALDGTTSSAQTDERGEFRLVGVPAGTVTVEAIGTVDGKRHTCRREGVDVGVGGVVTGIDLELAPR